MSDRYAVFGNPVAHSRSPLIHTEFARQTGQDISYSAILAPLDGFPGAVRDFAAQGARGANVTLPFKVEAYALANSVTARAESARAANTLVFERGLIEADNTDGAGLVTDLQINLGCPVRAKRVLLMGAGGAARGVLLPLLIERPASITIANRTQARAQGLQVEFAAIAADRGAQIQAIPLQASDYAGLRGCEFDLVINATSSSLGRELPPLPVGVFSREALAYDMMYGSGLTPFLEFALAQGVAHAADGLGMLVEQAAESFFLWRRVRPDTRPVLARLRSVAR
jgi:shikimate dehydrogenase